MGKVEIGFKHDSYVTVGDIVNVLQKYPMDSRVIAIDYDEKYSGCDLEIHGVVEGFVYENGDRVSVPVILIEK